MRIINNSTEVLEQLQDYNNCKNSENIQHMNNNECSTSYTNIPHQHLKFNMEWIVNTMMTDDKKVYVSSNGKYVSFKYRRRIENQINSNKLVNHIHYLIHNILITVSDKVYRQVIGIPMCTDCDPFLANLYLYALEFKFLQTMTRQNYIYCTQV